MLVVAWPLFAFLVTPDTLPHWLFCFLREQYQ
jgi:hypothetical protein